MHNLAVHSGVKPREKRIYFSKKPPPAISAHGGIFCTG